MKNLKIIIVCLSLNLICFAGIYAQQIKDTMSLLAQNEWITVYNIGKNDSIVSTLHFSQTEYTEKNHYKEAKSEVSVKYYLSDKPDTIFDHNKVGKIFNGRYIITINKYSFIAAYEIINISDTEFEYAIVNPNEQTRSSENQTRFTARIKPK